MMIDALKEEALKKRFLTLWDNVDEESDRTSSIAVWEQLAAHYSGPGRHYHTLSHLQHCIEQLDLAFPGSGDHKALEIAIYFHDVICEPDATDNEQKSAVWFEQIANGRYSQEFTSRVINMILSTTHNTRPASDDEKLICDIDLSSFALPWEEFLRDSNAVRAEHIANNDQVFYPSKLKYLNAMRDRPAIYQTEFFNQHYEMKAKKNITRYINTLNNAVEDTVVIK